VVAVACFLPGRARVLPAPSPIMIYGDVRPKNTHPVRGTTCSGHVGSVSALHAYSPYTLNTCAQKSPPPLITRGSVPHSTMPEVCIQIKMRALAQTDAYEGKWASISLYFVVLN